MKGASKHSLRSFLANPAGANLVPFDEVRGFIFAVAGTPELIPPSEWLPEAFGGKVPEFENTEQAQGVFSDLMNLYNSAAAGGRQTLSQAPAFREEAISNLGEDAAVGRWARGFLRGHSFMQEVWNEFIPEELEEEFASILLVLTFFASREMAEAYRAETPSRKPLDNMAETMRRTFGDAMVEYVRLGHAIYQARLQHDRAPATPRETTGRNAPCPCGSGKKYKRCCSTI